MPIPVRNACNIRIFGALLGASLLGLTAMATVPADATTHSTATVTAAATAAAVGSNGRTPTWVPEGGLSDQARAALERSATARQALQFYRPFETGDTGVYDRLLTEDFVDEPLAPGQGPGRQGMKDHVLDDIVATFPDLRIRVEAIHVAGHVVTVRSVISGTQAGPFLGVPATHRHLSYRAVDVHRFSHGQIARTDHLEDFFGAYRQMTR